MACHLFSTKLLSDPMMPYCQLDPYEHISKEIFVENSKVFIQENALENVACEMAAILSWPQFKNTLRPRQNGSQFVYSISQFINFFYQNHYKFHWSLFWSIQLTIRQHLIYIDGSVQDCSISSVLDTAVLH